MNSLSLSPQISLLLCLCLYIWGYSIVKYFKRTKESGALNSLVDYKFTFYFTIPPFPFLLFLLLFLLDEQDAIVYKIT